MARAELRKPLDTLFTAKNELDKQMTQIKDRMNVLQERLQKERNEQFSYREAKEHLQNTASNKPARAVFDQNIVAAQKNIEDVSKEMDKVSKDYEVVNSKIKAMEKSIKELQNA